MEVKPLGPIFGAEISGIDLGDISDEQFSNFLFTGFKLRCAGNPAHVRYNIVMGAAPGIIQSAENFATATARSAITTPKSGSGSTSRNDP